MYQMVYLSDSYIQASAGNTVALQKYCIESKVKSGDIWPHFYFAIKLEIAPCYRVQHTRCQHTLSKAKALQAWTDNLA